jgi:MoaA/NifB/PqqE/SkfB family radical SAM enzyme
MPRYSAPVRASVDVTYACDLRCIHCRTNTGEIPKHIRRRMLSMGQLKDLMCELDSMKTFEITLTGGEPTIRKGFYDLIGVTPRLTCSTITLITNAAGLSRDQMDQIVGSGVDAIRVSVDGTRETFAAIRLADAFDQVIENAAYLSQRVSSFRILTTVMKTNLHDVFNLTNFLRRAGFRRQNYILVRAHGRGGRNRLLLSEAETMNLSRQVQEFRRRVPDEEFNLQLNAPYLVPGRGNQPSEDVVMFPYVVRDSSVAVSATGDVTMSRLYSPQPLGNIKDRPISEIWAEAQEQLDEEIQDYTEEQLREIFWDFSAAETPESVPLKLTSLLDRQVFEGYEVR